MNKLDDILSSKRFWLEENVSSEAMAAIRRRAMDEGPTRGFLSALKRGPRPALIAEVKKASPVAGMIRSDFDPVQIALSYERAGASCLSVLTDVEYFQGSTENLVKCKAATHLPVLRKDFTAGEFHVWEARAMGADAILLIVYGLSDSELREYRELAESLGMDVIVEAHSEDECERALASGATILGINNRDLKSFETSLSVGMGLIPVYCDRAFVISESALDSHVSVQAVSEVGADAVLIGTAFMKQVEIEAAVKDVMGW